MHASQPAAQNARTLAARQPSAYRLLHAYSIHNCFNITKTYSSEDLKPGESPELQSLNPWQDGEVRTWDLSGPRVEPGLGLKECRVIGFMVQGLGLK